MNFLLEAALAVYSAYSAAAPQQGWDLGRCERSADKAFRGGHVCTVEHLEKDRAEIATAIAGESLKGKPADITATIKIRAEIGFLELNSLGNQAGSASGPEPGRPSSLKLPAISLDVARCERSASDRARLAGHVCSPEHLASDRVELEGEMERNGSTAKASELAATLKVRSEIGYLELSRLSAGESAATAAFDEAATVKWVDGAENSQAIFRDGVRVKILRTPEASVLVALDPASDPLRIQVHIVNHSAKPADAIPESMRLAVLEPKDRAQSLPYLSPAQIQQNIQRSAKWAMVLQGIAGALNANTPTTTTTVSGAAAAVGTRGAAVGAYGEVIKTYDNAAKQRETADRISDIARGADVDAARQTSGVFLANTLFPGEGYGGVVHFKRERKASLYVIRIPFADRIFEIPIAAPPSP